MRSISNFLAMRLLSAEIVMEKYKLMESIFNFILKQNGDVWHKCNNELSDGPRVRDSMPNEVQSSVSKPILLSLFLVR